MKYKTETMDFRCKFVLAGDSTESYIFDSVKERIMEELSWDINGLDHMEFEYRDYCNEMNGMVRVPVVFKFHTIYQEESTTLFDIYTWVCGMIRHYGRNFGIDEIAVDGLQVDIPEIYRVPQLIVEL